MKVTTTLFSLLAESGAGQNLQKTWRDAASIIMVYTGSGTSPTTKPKYLMMERSQGSSFMPGGLCYPGGTVSPSDSCTSWVNLYKTHSPGHKDIEKLSFLHSNAKVPEIYDDEEFKSSTNLSKQISLRITAIRELFEECGILLCEPTANLDELKSNKTMLKDWQNRVKKQPNDFIILCSTFQVVPNLAALVDWSNWLTPVTYSSAKRRFDTIFYMTIVDQIPEVLTDSYEVADSMWSTAAQYLEEDSLGKRKLMPPQAYEMFRLTSSTVSELKRLLELRIKFGIERWCPFLYKAKDGLMGVLPGDDLYPRVPDVYTLTDFVQLDQTIEELQLSTKNHHRWMFLSDSRRKLSVNIETRNGQFYN